MLLNERDRLRLIEFLSSEGEYSEDRSLMFHLTSGAKLGAVGMIDGDGRERRDVITLDQPDGNVAVVDIAHIIAVEMRMAPPTDERQVRWQQALTDLRTAALVSTDKTVKAAAGALDKIEGETDGN